MLVLHARSVVPLQVGVIGRRTELVLIPSGHGHMRIVSPHELALGRLNPDKPRPAVSRGRRLCWQFGIAIGPSPKHNDARQ